MEAKKEVIAAIIWAGCYVRWAGGCLDLQHLQIFGPELENWLAQVVLSERKEQCE
jgi:hypothetical protein